MKKFFSWMLVAVTALLASCSQQEDIVNDSDGDILTTISVGLPQGSLLTRTGSNKFADPELSDMRVYVYICKDGKIVSILHNDSHSFGDGRTQCTFQARLVKGQTYDINAWCDFGSQYYTIPTGESYKTETVYPVIKMASTTITGSDNKYDAYFKNVTTAITENQTIDIVCQRPFALVKVNTTDWDEKAVKNAQLRPDHYTTTFYAPTQLNLITGVADTEQDVTVKNETEIVEYDQDGATKELHYDYLFANSERNTLNDFTVEYLKGTNKVTENSDYTFQNIPVQRNYKTNITGNILTKVGKIYVTIDSVWYVPTDSVKLFSTYDEAQNYLNEHKNDTGNTTLVIDEEIESGETKYLYIPDNTTKSKWSFKLENIQEGGKIEVYDEHPDNGDVNYKNEVEVILPDGIKASNALINTPNAHATISGSFGTVDATTDENTLVVSEGTTVDNLIIRKGGLEIHGTVKAAEVIIEGSDKVYVRDCEDLIQSVYEVLEPYIDVDNGYAGVQHDNLWDIKILETNAVARIDETKYYALASAIKAATSGQTVELLKDCRMSSTIAVDQNVTLDLKKFTVTSCVSGDYLFTVASGKSFTMKDGSVADGSEGAATGLIKPTEATIVVSNVNFGTFNTAGDANILFPMTGSTSLTLTDVTVTTNNNVVKTSGNSNTLVVTNGTYIDTKRNGGTHTFDLLEYDTSSALFDGVTITSPDAAERQSCIETDATKGTSNIVLKNCTIKAEYGNTVYAAADMTIINCDIETADNANNVYHALSVESEHTLNIYGGTYKGSTKANSAALKIWTSGGIIKVYDKYNDETLPVVMEGTYLFYIDSNNKEQEAHTAEVYFEGDNIQTKGQWAQQHVAKAYVKGGYHDCTVWYGSNANSFILSGGTYTMDPSSKNCFQIAEGYKIVDNGNNTWTVKATTGTNTNTSGFGEWK